MSKKKGPFKCLGFGDFENKCGDPCTSSPFWCERCNKLRMEHLGRRFEDLAKTGLQRAPSAS